MDKKIYLLLMILSVIVLRSTALEPYNMKGSSALDRKEAANDDDDDGDEKSEREEHELITPLSTSRRNRFQGYGSPLNNQRSRSRWSPPPPPSSVSSDDDSFGGNDWGRSGGFGLNNILSGLTGLFGQAQLDNTPTCLSLLDPQFPLFSDICGVMPQARYSLPNYFGHVERWQIAQTLTTLLGPTNPSLSNPTCARSLKLLICPLLFPPCKTARRELPPVLPCQPFCRAVKGQCPAPSLDLLPCDFLPPTSELCPANPAPYSSLLSSFGSSFPMNAAGLSPAALSGLTGSSLSALLAQSALSNGLSPMGAMPPTTLPLTGLQGNLMGPGANGLSSYLQSGLPGTGMPKGTNGLSPYLASGLQGSGLAAGTNGFPSYFQTGFQGSSAGTGASGLSPFLPTGLQGSSAGAGTPGLSPFLSTGLQGSAVGTGTAGLSPAVQTSQTPQMSSSYQNYLSTLSAGSSGPTGPTPTKQAAGGFNAAQYAADSLTPVLVDFPPLATVHDMRQANRFFPLLRSSSEKA